MVRRVSEIAFVGIVALGVAYYAATTLPIGLSQLSSAAAHRPAQPGGQPAPAAPARSTTTTSVGAVRSVAKAPSTIDTTCRADVTSAILTWVASVPDGSTVTFTKNACYRVEGSLTFQGRHGLTFEGNGATFKSTTLGPLDKRGHSQRRHFWFVDCQNITVRNINVVGNNTRSDNG